MDEGTTIQDCRGSECPHQTVCGIGDVLSLGSGYGSQFMSNTRIVEEKPRLALACPQCGTRIRASWRTIVGRATCSRCGATLPRFLPFRIIPWWIVLHLNERRNRGSGPI